MSQIISKKQVLAHNLDERYRPYVNVPFGVRRNEEEIDSGYPLFESLCSITELSCRTREPITYPVIPDGCVNMVFCFRRRESTGRIYGPVTTLHKLLIKPGESYLAFKFVPGSCKAFVECDINELTNSSKPISEVISGGDEIIEIMGRDISLQWKALLMSRILKAHQTDHETDYLIRFCVKEMERVHGNIRISELARRTGFSERYLGKLFERCIGLSPKTFAGILRIQNSLHTLFDRRNRSSLLEIAMDCGYYDHAHMNRAYNNVFQCSSGALRKRGFNVIEYDDIPEFE